MGESLLQPVQAPIEFGSWLANVVSGVLEKSNVEIGREANVAK